MTNRAIRRWAQAAAVLCTASLGLTACGSSGDSGSGADGTTRPVPVDADARRSRD